MNDALLACLQDMAGQHIRATLSPVTGDMAVLPDEQTAIAKAIPKRRAEFAAGRRAARGALAELGLGPTAIPQGLHRCPIWPTGVVGSISHDNGLAAAVVAKSDVVHRLGIDLADASGFPDHLRSQILHSASERLQSDIEARISFSAKECVFKAFYRDVEAYFGFDAVEVSPDLSRGIFDVVLTRGLGPVPVGSRFQGRCAILDKRLITLLADPHP